MVVKQLSVFLENKTNSLNEMLQILEDNGINMSAFCIADSVDYGIVRFCVGRPELAYSILKDHNYTVRLTDVVCIEVPNQSGGLHKVIQIISGNGINIEYMYAFTDNGKAKAIIRCSSTEKLMELAQVNHLVLATI